MKPSDKQFHVEKLTVPDPAVWPTDPNQTVVRYALVDDTGAWWHQGHVFGSLEYMKYDRSSSDGRQYLRESEADAWRDVRQWYTWEEKDGRYVKVYI